MLSSVGVASLCMYGTEGPGRIGRTETMSTDHLKETMTVGDLLERLQGVDRNTPVLIAEQPAWPFECTIGEIAVVNVGEEVVDDDGEVTFEDGVDVLYISTGYGREYLASQAREPLNW